MKKFPLLWKILHVLFLIVVSLINERYQHIALVSRSAESNYKQTRLGMFTLTVLCKFNFSSLGFFFLFFQLFQEIFSYCRFTPSSRLKELYKDKDSIKRHRWKYFCNLLSVMFHIGGPKIHGKSTPPTLQHFSCTRVGNRELSFSHSAHFEQLTFVQL